MNSYMCLQDMTSMREDFVSWKIDELQILPVISATAVRSCTYLCYSITWLSAR